MSKLWLIGLAASAAWTPAAIAQGAPPPPPKPPMAHGAHAPAPPMSHHGMHHRMPGPGSVKGFHRIGRGGMLPPHFMAPQFFVHDWQMFGFPAPMPGGHWVRYYDDALLVDRDGRVMDARHGWDWDRRGGHHDDDDRDYDDVDDDYADDRDYDDDDDMRGHHRDGKRVVDVLVRRDDMRGHHGDREVRVYRHDGPGKCRRGCKRKHHRMMMPPPPAWPGYGYGYGYGYGAGCGCGAVVVTETTTTYEPVVETRTYYETVRAAPRHRAKPVRHYAKPVPRKPVKVAPRPGERG